MLLESFQLEIARTVTGARKGTSHNLIYNETGWETLSCRREKAKLFNFHQIVYGTAPNYLCNVISKGKDERYNLRNADNLPIPKVRTETFKKSFIPSTTSLWNNLDLETKQIVNLSAFKQKLKKDECCNLLFCTGSRTTNIKHAQLRMNCSKLNSHLYSLHVVDNPMCICVSDYEDPFNFFYMCPMFRNQRLRGPVTICQKKCSRGWKWSKYNIYSNWHQ